MKKILSLLISIVMLFSITDAYVFAQDVSDVIVNEQNSEALEESIKPETNASWRGSANFNDYNNQVTDTAMPTDSAYTMIKWVYELNTDVDNWGAYYAGQSVIADGYLYATGGERLHKVDISTGEGEILAIGVGTTGNYYDYLCYADGILIVSTQNKLEAYSTSGELLGYTEGSFGYYHPVVYHDGYVICNGFIYKLSVNESTVAFEKVSDTAIGGDKFNWNSGVFIGDLFYTAAKTTVYAVNYKTGELIDSYVFDENRRTTSNVQGGMSYDAKSGKVFWATYYHDTSIHSIAIDDSGNFDKESYHSGDALQKSVCTPVVYNGRVYLAGQSGMITVLDANDLSLIYSAETQAGKIQSNPIISIAQESVRLYFQGYDGHLYMAEDTNDAINVSCVGTTMNYTGVKYPNSYEQIAVDEAGNIYCYNESGYLFCFEKTECEVPEIICDLSSERVKIAKDEAAEALVVEADGDINGELSYKWQRKTDVSAWEDISDATANTYVPNTDTEGNFYYRCIVTNTLEDKTSYAISTPAHIYVKVLSSDTTLNVMVNAANSATTKNPQQAAAEDDALYVTQREEQMTNIWVGTVSDAVVESFEILYGLPQGVSTPKFVKITAGNVYEGVTYNGYYRSTSYSLPVVAKASVVAEDGISKADYYIVIDSQEKRQYVVDADGFTADSEEYFDAEAGITFTAAEQEVTLKPESELIGDGESSFEEWSWSSSDLSVATVDENGKVKSIGGGSASITATCGRISVTCGVNSSAEKHSVHTYVDKICSVCTMAEPQAVSASFTLFDQNGNVAVSKDETTQLYEISLSIDDADCDGKITFNDAFIILHREHSANGAEDFKSQGGWITRLWGVDTYNLGYLVNNMSSELLKPLSSGDAITAFFYRDTLDFSDIYTYFEKDSMTVSAGNETEITLNGLSPMSGTQIIPVGATVSVFDKNNSEVSEMATTVSEEGKISLTFAEAGEYTLQVSGSCRYTGSAWDYEENDYVSKEFENAPVVLSHIKITVMPHAEATVYVTISDAKGEFSTGKNGEVMYRLPIKATDNPNNPDGQVTINEVIAAAHEQYHPDGAAAFVANNGFITHLWGVNTGGNIGYYFNDVYMNGSGTKVGTNGREWQDKLLNTVVCDGDSFNIYALQDTKSWSDVYTYFNPVSESAVAGKAVSIKVCAATYSGEIKPAGAKVIVKNSKGKELEELNSVVGDDGTFKVTFPSAGTYTVDVKSSDTSYFVPSRCTVYVSRAGGGGSSGTEKYVYISVADPKGKTYQKKTAYTFEDGESAYSLLLKTGLEVKESSDNQFGGVYIEAIAGLGEFDEGSESGWMYSVNGEYPTYSSSLYELSEGDYVKWVYTRNRGEDVGDTSYVSSGSITKTYTVKFETNTATAVKSQSVKQNKTVTEPDEPEKDGYIFDGWYSDENLINKYDFSAKVTKSFTLYAKWSKVEENSNEPEKAVFSDVADDAWYKAAVDYVSALGLMRGVSDTEFAPDAVMSRAMLVTVIYRMENEPEAGETVFDDVKADSYYEKAVAWAYENKIVSGISENEFAPDSEITREQLVTIILRYAEYKNIKISSDAELAFEDKDEVSDWAKDAVAWATSAGIVKGVGENRFAPHQNASRAQVAQILMQFYEKI